MNIKVTRRRTSRMSIRIGSAGDVRVSAPAGTSDAVVRRFVEEHSAWIEQALRKTADRRKCRKDFFDRLPLDTQQQADDTVRRMNLTVRPMVERYRALMGLPMPYLSYKATTSRWGSCCKATRRISLSVYLLLLPEWCMESVVVHELAHLIEANHGPRFYAVMDRYYPRWQDARREIRRIVMSSTET